MAKTVPDWYILVVTFAAIFHHRGTARHRGRFFLWSVFYFYGCCVLAATLMPVVWKLPNIWGHGYSLNLIPFRDLLHGWGDSAGQIALTVLLFLPFGFLLPILTGKKFFPTLLLAAAASGAIELLQPLFDRRGDITDFITNTLGCGCGYLLQLPLGEEIKRRLHWNEK